MGEFAIPLAVLSGVAEVGKGFAQSSSADSSIRALELQGKQESLSFQQKTLNNYDVTQKLLEHQTAQMTTRGVGSGSPSFNAIQRNTVNIGAKESKNLETEHSIFEENIDIEKRNVRDTFYSQLFGDITEAGMSFASFIDKFPFK